MIKSVMEKHTVNWLKRANEKKNLDFTISIQRKEVWNSEHKSNLIGAMLLGIPVESLLFEEESESEEGYLVLDGKQRCLTILRFLNNEFAISANCKVQQINSENIVGKTFSELSESLQEALKDYELTLSVMRPLTEDERELIFFMRNQAIALTKVELMRVLMGSQTLNVVKTLVEHPLIEKLKLGASKGYRDQQVVTEILILETGKDYSFSGKDLMAFAEEIKKDGIEEDTQATILKVFDYLNAAIPDKYRIRKIHIPMLYIVASTAIDDGTPPEKFFEWVKCFFKNNKGADNDYTRACESGILLKNNIKARIDYMMNDYVDFI